MKEFIPVTTPLVKELTGLNQKIYNPDVHVTASPAQPVRGHLPVKSNDFEMLRRQQMDARRHELPVEQPIRKNVDQKHVSAPIDDEKYPVPAKETGTEEVVEKKPAVHDHAQVEQKPVPESEARSFTVVAKNLHVQLPVQEAAEDQSHLLQENEAKTSLKNNQSVSAVDVSKINVQTLKGESVQLADEASEASEQMKAGLGREKIPAAEVSQQIGVKDLKTVTKPSVERLQENENAKQFQDKKATLVGMQSLKVGQNQENVDEEPTKQGPLEAKDVSKAHTNTKQAQPQSQQSIASIVTLQREPMTQAQVSQQGESGHDLQKTYSRQMIKLNQNDPIESQILLADAQKKPKPILDDRLQNTDKLAQKSDVQINVINKGYPGDKVDKGEVKSVASEPAVTAKHDFQRSSSVEQLVKDTQLLKPSLQPEQLETLILKKNKVPDILSSSDKFVSHLKINLAQAQYGQGSHQGTSEKQNTQSISDITNVRAQVNYFFNTDANTESTSIKPGSDSTQQVGLRHVTESLTQRVRTSQNANSIASHLVPREHLQKNAAMIGEKINQMLSKNIQKAEIQLEPANLGRLKIQIQVGQDQQASLQFIAQVGQTRDLVEQALPRLREMLANQGITLGQTQVEHQSAGQSGQQFSGQLAQHDVKQSAHASMAHHQVEELVQEIDSNEIGALSQNVSDRLGLAPARIDFYA